MNRSPGGSPGSNRLDVELELRRVPGVVAVRLEAGRSAGAPRESAGGSEGVAPSARGRVVLFVAGDEPNPDRDELIGDVLRRCGWGSADVVVVPLSGEALRAGGSGRRYSGRAWPARRADARRVRHAGARTLEAGGVEVTLVFQRRRGRGRAGPGPLGAAQATLSALRDLGAEVPFRLVELQADARGVAVALVGRGRPRRGIAARPDLLEAASRATLASLNRYLAREQTQVRLALGASAQRSPRARTEPL